MMIDASIHNVVKLEVERVRSYTSDGYSNREFFVRKLIATSQDGTELCMVLFSDVEGALNIVERKE